MALKAVKVTDVKNVPASRSLALPGAIAGMQYDSISGKYFAPINAADYTYFGQKGFVDIENGTFYDSTGISYGYSLVLPDYIALLNKLTVMVVYNINEKPKKYDLVYRTAQAISQQSASQPAASGK